MTNSLKSYITIQKFGVGSGVGDETKLLYQDMSDRILR